MNAENSFDEVRACANTEDHAERGASIAAFFDLDGTLLPLPSLEKRFFRVLRYRRAIGVANYLLWVVEAARLLPRGIKSILYANKMYLCGVRVSEADQSQAWKGVLEGIRFYPGALERLAWHATRSHAIVIVTGTLEPLAIKAAAALEGHLASRGMDTTIGVYATRLGTRDGAWTGRISGEALFREAKAQAIKEIAASRHFELDKCFAYGDSTNDRFMLESVGRPTAVNPSNDFALIAARNHWPVLRWTSRHASQTPTSRNTPSCNRREAAAQELDVAPSKSGT